MAAEEDHKTGEISLEELLKNAFKRKKVNIAIVENLANPEVERQHIDHEESIEEFARKLGVEIHFLDYSYQKIRRDFEKIPALTQKRLGHMDLVLIKPNMNSFSPDLLGASDVAKAIKCTNPDLPVFMYFPKYNENMTNRAIDKVSSLFTDHFLDGRVLFDHEFGDKPTSIMNHLNELLTGIPASRRRLSQFAHSYKNEVWQKDYLPYIDRSLRAGNAQTNTDFHFLILSNKKHKLLKDGEYQPNADEKVKVRTLDYKLESEDFYKCAAIFVDNTWGGIIQHPGAIGQGIETLKQIREQLDAQGVNLPIVYQSMHDLKDFEDHEKKQIKDLGAVLTTKEIFPKVCRGKEKAQKETEISNILKESSLKQFAAEVYDFGDLVGPSELYVVCTKIIDPNNSKSDSIQDLYTHKMEVLASFHEIMKNHLDNKIASQPLINYFRDFQYVKQGLEEHPRAADLLRDPETEKLYESIRLRHEEELKNPTTIIHSDPKWDNWFGLTLGDFGDACAGTEYKDLARALLDKETGFEKVKDPKWVEDQVKTYLAARKDQPDLDSFVAKAKETIFIESLRLAKYKSQNQDPEKVVDGLLSVAAFYKEHLK